MACYNNKIQYNNKSNRFALGLLKLLIFLVTIRGFIENFVGYGTLFVDILLIVSVLYSFLYKYVAKSRIEILYLLLIIVCLFSILIQMAIERCTIMGGILAFRNDIAYTLSVMVCLRLLKTKEDCKELFNFIMKCGLFLCCFAIVQYFGRAFLPDSLLVLRGENHFLFWGTDVIRANGLVGNTVIFSGVTIIMTCYSWAQILNNEAKRSTWLIFITSIIANFLTFSRASAVGVIVAVVVEYVIVSSGKKSRKELVGKITQLVTFLIAALVLITVFWNKITNSIIFKRLTNQNTLWNESSDNIHVTSIKNAIELIKEFPIIGYGLGKVGYSAQGAGNVISDGTIWIYFLSWGVPICLIYWGVVSGIIFRAIKCINMKIKALPAICLGYFVSNMYLIAAALINSSYSSRIIMIYNWTIAGIILVWTSSESCLQEETELSGR